MMLFASFQGYGLGWSLIFWRILTAPALLLGLLGFGFGVFSERSGQSRRVAVGLGLAAVLIESLAVAFVLLCISGESAKTVERYGPGGSFWALSILTLLLGSLAVGLGLAGRDKSGSDGSPEL
jgi:hypothetical protein